MSAAVLVDADGIYNPSSSKASMETKGEPNENWEVSELSIHMGNTCRVSSDSSRHVMRPSSLPHTETRSEWAE